MSTLATEKLYRMLGMYEVLTDIKSDLESLFTGYARNFFSFEVTSIVAQLGNTIRHLSCREGRRQRREEGFVGTLLRCSRVTAVVASPRHQRLLLVLLTPPPEPSCSPAGCRPWPAAPPPPPVEREGKRWRGEGKKRLMCRIRVGPTLSQLSRWVKPESKPPRTQSDSRLVGFQWWEAARGLTASTASGAISGRLRGDVGVVGQRSSVGVDGGTAGSGGLRLCSLDRADEAAPRRQQCRLLWGLWTRGGEMKGEGETDKWVQNASY
uniref:Exocyst subunit Exo70 family protein n=1 Tax=Oryza barthii TaxID=65489 RepID=A0A0D3EJL1_9ORYZ